MELCPMIKNVGIRKGIYLYRSYWELLSEFVIDELYLDRRNV